MKVTCMNTLTAFLTFHKKLKIKWKAKGSQEGYGNSGAASGGLCVPLAPSPPGCTQPVPPQFHFKNGLNLSVDFRSSFKLGLIKDQIRFLWSSTLGYHSMREYSRIKTGLNSSPPVFLPGEFHG